MIQRGVGAVEAVGGGAWEIDLVEEVLDGGGARVLDLFFEAVDFFVEGFGFDGLFGGDAGSVHFLVGGGSGEGVCFLVKMGFGSLALDFFSS